MIFQKVQESYEKNKLNDEQRYKLIIEKIDYFKKNGILFFTDKEMPFTIRKILRKEGFVVVYDLEKDKFAVCWTGEYKIRGLLTAMIDNCGGPIWACILMLLTSIASALLVSFIVQ
jgi:hypothetical protein